MTPPAILSHTQHQSLKELKRKRKRPLWLIAIGALVAVMLGSSLEWYPPGSVYQKAAQQLVQRGPPSISRLLAPVESYRTWLTKRERTKAVAIFEFGAGWTLTLATFVHDVRVEPPEGTVDHKTWPFTLAVVLIRCGFVLLASAYVWIVVGLVTSIAAIALLAPHEGTDLLGKTGKGLAFYSGINIGLRGLGPDGAPNVLVRGLACVPKNSPLSRSTCSRLGRVLESLEATNETNRELARCLDCLAHVPAEIPSSVEVSGPIERRPISIRDHAVELLESVWRVKQAQDQAGNKQAYTADSDVIVRSTVDATDSVFQQALTPGQRISLSTVKSAELVTLILATLVGKGMAAQRDGTNWTLKSLFPNLTARAVLHSLESFAQNYDWASRQRIRRALVFGIRHYSLGSIALPVDMTPETEAMRGWCELCLANPSELGATARAVEKFNYYRQVHREFKKALAATMKTPDAEWSSSVWSCGAMALVPVDLLARVLGKCIDRSFRQRLIELELVGTIHVNQTPPLACSTIQERRELSEIARLHDVNVESVLVFNEFRPALNEQGWLCKKFPRTTIAGHGLIQAVVTPIAKDDPAALPNRIGIRGLVPLRAAMLSREFGDGWQKPFRTASEIGIATNEQDFRCMLAGEVRLEVISSQRKIRAWGGAV